MTNRGDSYLGRCDSCDPTHSSELRRASWLSFDAAFGAGWPTFTPGAARACVARIDRRVAGEQTGVSPHHTMTCTDVGGRVTDGAGSSVAAEWPDRARAVTLQPLPGWCCCVYKPGWLWPLRMAKRVSGRATRGGERRNTAVSGHRIRGARLERSLASAWTGAICQRTSVGL